MKDDQLLVTTTNVPVEIHNIAQAIAEGCVKNAKMEWSMDGKVVFHADSADGKSRIILEKRTLEGITLESKTSISQPSDKEERLRRVAALRKQGMTQHEISKYTITSQKTVSNDLKEIKLRDRSNDPSK